MTATLEDLTAALGPLRLPRQYVPLEPSVKQEFFLRQTALEVLFGGAAGPGKSWGLLMAASQYVDVAGYNAVILRTTLHDHQKAGALIPLSHEWFGGTDAAWNGSERKWTFPSGATITFGYLRTVADLSHWKGTAYQFVGFDELTEFDQAPYIGISRVMRDAPEIADGIKVPIRKWSASNPGGPGHGWVKEEMVDAKTRKPGVVFIKATIHDNPKPGFYDEYMLSLAHLSPVDRMRLIDGDWDVLEEGGKFRREYFPILEGGLAAAAPIRAVRYWDLAGTEPSPAHLDPDWTVGMLVGVDATGMFTILGIARARLDDAKVQNLVRDNASDDRERLAGVPVYTFIEQDPGQAGKAQVRHYQREVLQGFACYAGQTRIRGVNAAKEIRAAPVAAAASNGLYRTLPFAERAAFLDEVALFPGGNHDDQVDALSGAHNALTTRIPAGSGVHTSRPTSRRLPVASDRLRPGR